MAQGKRNRLAKETSPYLQQHSRNPVDWYPWGEEALRKAKTEEKPIFLSIGYSACHWCHVMERESFENESTAKLLNENFVSIKVDREERPDLDHIYMSAVQLMTQRGGWPMSVFLTPDLQPFYGGTYFPPEDRMGMPSFNRVIGGVVNAWKGKRKEILETAGQLTGAIEQMQKTGMEAADASPTLELVAGAVQRYVEGFDSRFGGFGTAPKFFHTAALRLMLRHWKAKNEQGSLDKVTFTLEKLARGGIYDHLGGGFHRYSTDQQWLVPHFEKMLYDNALLAQLYLETYQATKNKELARTASETLDYVLREMTSPEGGFYSTQDADTEGEEGKFYVWSREEITELLDRDLSKPFNTVFSVTPAGNWEGKSILNMKESLSETAKHLGEEVGWLEDNLAHAKRKLYTARAKRDAPFRDEKVVVAWNGLMIESMALGGCILGDERFIQAAEKAASFVLEKMRGTDGKSLLHTYKDKLARLPGYLDDYGAMINACLSLFEFEGKERWLTAARELAEVAVEEFWDAKEHAFYYTGKSSEKLVTRPRENQDGAVPSGAALVITGITRLGHINSDPKWLKLAETALRAQTRLMQQAPMAAGQFLLALELLLDRPKEIVVFPGTTEDLYSEVRDAIWSRFLPNRVILFAGDKGTANLPLMQNRGAKDGKTTVYVCEGFTCQNPVSSVEDLEKTLDGA